MKRDDSVYISHILEAGRKALGFIKDRIREDLDNNEMLALSLIRLLEIIGEAGNQISSSLRDKYPHLPWKQMTDMRNRLIHAYFNVDYDIVWDTVSNDLPQLITELEKILEK
ncbi:DUF86 domain-containing protein [candidate division WOR-3 bacterium]|nr:DUF86 domain-containing protein [candidate division WOR-3 bacterium]